MHGSHFIYRFLLEAEKANEGTVPRGLRLFSIAFPSICASVFKLCLRFYLLR